MERVDLDRAGEFIWQFGRLLERRRFAHSFLGGHASAVAAAVLAYRNDDGGFGNALEPDCRTPHSQPEATRIGLAVLGGVGQLDRSVAESAGSWLASVVTSEGAVPFCLPSVSGFPRAPWWEPTDPLVANVTPTGGLVALLCAAGVRPPWLATAERWCFDEYDRQRHAGEPLSQYAVHSLSDLCGHAEDTDRASKLLDDLRDHLASGRVIPLDPAQRPEPDTHTPLQFAPTPHHPLRQCFTDSVIEAFLDHLESEQQPDGGWPIDWPAPGDVAVWEWRGERTLDALETLQSYGRIRS